ncbi:UDP-N-acetylenolpyruvoylglucosamine reductase [Candidatus Hepatincola sp. Pdp]
MNKAYEFLQQQTGRVNYNHSLKNLNWFKVGGEADAFFIPQDTKDLQLFLKNKPQDVAFFVVGAGSNILIRDGGFKGVVIKLSNLNKMSKVADYEIYTEAGCLNISVANFAKDLQIGGLEFLSGIPGSIGGAITMNAGAFAYEFKDVCTTVNALNLQGELVNFTNEEMGFSYRQNSLEEPYIFIGANLQGQAKDEDEILIAMEKIKESREESQPKKVLTGGSTFTNPKGFKAWELIDRAGLRGYSIGGASFSEKHCNFIINDGSATAADIENLISYAIKKVAEKFNILLHPEIKIIGEN